MLRHGRTHGQPNSNGSVTKFVHKLEASVDWFLTWAALLIRPAAMGQARPQSARQLLGREPTRVGKGEG